MGLHQWTKWTLPRKGMHFLHLPFRAVQAIAADDIETQAFRNE